MLIDDVEEPINEISPSETVYSYFLFVGPIESKKEGEGTTMDTIMAWVLVLLNLSMQGILLFAIWDAVVVNNVSWQASIMSPGDDGGLGMFSTGTGCNDGGSLCTMMNGTYTCAPPSVQLAGRWDELDLNKDGIWARQEAVEARDELKCKYVADPIEVFDVFVKFLLKREGLIWIDPELRAGQRISKAYFDYAAGDINMCGYRNTDMCSNVMKRGLFDAALEHGTAPRVGTTIDSAMDYCYDLLKPGGACERFLPSTYKVWKKASVKQCGEEKYHKFTYESPMGDSVSLLDVDYKKRLSYAQVQTQTFKIYKTVILGLYICAMVLELKGIWLIINFCIKFPGCKSAADGVEKTEEDGATKYEITAITALHRTMMSVVTLVRLVMLMVLTVVGLFFLNKQVGYVGLLLDGIAMLFVLEISNILYSQVLRKSVQEQTTNVEPMRFDAIGFDCLNRRPAVRSFLLLLFMVVSAVMLVDFYNGAVARPLYDSLTCTCIGEGEKCFESQRFSKEFWTNYWKEVVPGTIVKIKAQAAASRVTLLSHGRKVLHSRPGSLSPF